MDEDLTVGFKELTTDWDGHDYEVAHRLTAWFNWADDNENEEDRAYLAVTLTDTGSIEVGAKVSLLVLQQQTPCRLNRPCKRL